MEIKIKALEIKFQNKDAIKIYNQEVVTMKSFEERKNEYLDRLRLNIDVVEKFLYDEKYQKYFELNPNSAHNFLMPETEDKLKFANLCLCFAIDLISFVEDLSNDNIEKIDIEKSELLNFYVESINAIKNRDEFRIKGLRYIYANRNLDETGAKLFYEENVIFKTQAIDFVDQVQKKSGFKTKYDKLETLQFRMLLNELITKITASQDVKKPKVTDDLDGYANFVCEFHKLYNKGIKNQRTNGKENQYKK